MFYKKNDDDTWQVGNEIHFPNGTILNNENKIEYDGWFWSDDEPMEYTKYKNKINEMYGN
jgi:hypothetical protein